MRRSILFFVMLLLVMSLTAFADDGGTVAERTAKTCAGCHGTYGASPGEYIPVIGGQHADFLNFVMLELKNKHRTSSVEMTYIASGYTEEQIKAISAWHASKPWVSTKVKVDAYDSQAASKLVENYSCFGCHEKNGMGGGEVPRIAGQAPGFLKNVMTKYKNGEIKSGDMEFFKVVSDDDIKLMSSYIAEIGRKK